MAALEGEWRRREAQREVAPGILCRPSHLTHFEPSFIELTGIL